MSKYTVTITQQYSHGTTLWPYKVEVRDSNGHLIDWDISMTRWGARFYAWRLVRRAKRPSFKPTIVEEYEAEDAR